MKICQARPQLVFTFDNRFSSTGWAVPQSVRYRIFRLQASYLSATSHTGRKSCRVKSLYMKRFWLESMNIGHHDGGCPGVGGGGQNMVNPKKMYNIENNRKLYANLKISPL